MWLVCERWSRFLIRCCIFSDFLLINCNDFGIILGWVLFCCLIRLRLLWIVVIGVCSLCEVLEINWCLCCNCWFCVINSLLKVWLRLLILWGLVGMFKVGWLLFGLFDVYLVVCNSLMVGLFSCSVKWWVY